MFVFALTEDGPKQIAVNEVARPAEEFRGTPAVSDGKLVMRSSAHLYCVTDKGDEVVRTDPVAEPENEQPAEANGRGGRGGEGGQRGDGGQQNRFDPVAMFNRMDTDSDGAVTAAELEGNPMADRLMTLDSNGDGKVSLDEFQNGMANLFRRGGGGGGRGGEGPGRGDSRPQRPQRPELAG